MDIKKSVFESSGIKDWNNKEATDRAMEHINAGLWNAVGTGKWDRLQNQGYVKPGSGGGNSYEPFTRVAKTKKGEGSYTELDKALRTLDDLDSGKASEKDYHSTKVNIKKGMWSPLASTK